MGVYQTTLHKKLMTEANLATVVLLLSFACASAAIHVHQHTVTSQHAGVQQLTCTLYVQSTDTA